MPDPTPSFFDGGRPQRIKNALRGRGFLCLCVEDKLKKFDFLKIYGIIVIAMEKEYDDYIAIAALVYLIIYVIFLI